MITVQQLSTERLILKKVASEDLNDYIEWKSQESYHEFLPSKPKTNTEYAATLREIIKGYDDATEPTLLWGVFFKGQLIGSVSIENWNTTHKWCELGWGLNPKYQKQGLAFEAVQGLINYIFKTLKMNRVSAVIWDGNNASKRLATKLGFVQEGIDRKARFKNNHFINVYRYGMLVDEWVY